MAFKFEGLGVWQLAIAYTDAAYDIAEGSTGQRDDEQNRFLGYALRSLVETVACLHLIRRRGDLADPTPLRATYREAEQLFAKLHAFRRTPRAGKPSGVREGDAPYNPDTPF